MITRFATLTGRMAVALTMVFAITACGGGGGGGGGFLGEGGDDDDAILSIRSQLLDADGNTTSTINPNAPATLEVTVTKGGSRAPDVIVDISTGSGLLSPASASKLTNAQGIATLRVEAGTGKGADQIVIDARDDSGATAQDTVNFQVGVENLKLGRFIDGVFYDTEIDITPEGQIPSAGTAFLSLAIVDENDELVGSAESVKFSSPCLNSGASTISPSNPGTTDTGLLTVTYSSSRCEGADSITAEVVGSGAQAFGEVEVAAAGSSSMNFIGADPALIVLKGTGGTNRPENSTLTFKTVDTQNSPVEGVEVRFELSTDVGGVRLTPSAAISNASGLVSTTVSSGDVATAVRVIATTDAIDGSGEISVVSDLLAITTGLPDQDSISLGVAGDFVVEEAMFTIGLTRQISVRMADKFNNPVPDGTAAVFTTEYGAIESSCTTTDGECSVTWTSQNPKFPLLGSVQELVKRIDDPGYSCPAHNGSDGPCPADMGSVHGGRSTILVTAVGEESFIDRNGNGIFDQAEAEAEPPLFSNLTEAFIDHNEDGDGPNIRNPHLHDPFAERCQSNPDSRDCMSGLEEEFMDYNSNGVFDANGDSPDNGYPDEGVTAVFNGLLCPPEGDNVWCSRELLNVWDSTVLILGGGPPYYLAVYRGRTRVSSTSAGNTYEVYVSDIYNNRPPADATVEITTTGDCTATLESDPAVPNTNSHGAFGVSFSQGGVDDPENTEEDTVVISIANSSISLPCTPGAAEVPDEGGDGPVFSPQP